MAKQWLAFPFLKLQGAFPGYETILIAGIDIFQRQKYYHTCFSWWSAEKLNCGVSEEELIGLFVVPDSSSPTGNLLAAGLHVMSVYS